MASELLELTFTGLCVLLIHGPEGKPNPTSVEVLMVDAAGHVPRMTFRGLDLANVDPADACLKPIRIGTDGEEVFELPIPPGAEIKIEWGAGGVPIPIQNSMPWDGSVTSMHNVPDLDDFNVAEVHRDGTNAAARITKLPLGRLEARRIVKKRDQEVLWTFTGMEADARRYANQVTLYSEAETGTVLNVTIGGTTYEFLSGDRELPVRIALTNLPPEGKFVERETGYGEVPPHLHKFEKIVKSLKPSTAFRPFSRFGGGATREGGICPTPRIHVSP